MRVLTALFACAFVLAACGSSGSGKSTTTKTIGNSVPPTDPPTTPAAPIAVAACSLVKPADVTALLGGAAKGTESDPQPVYKNCEWDTAAATGTGPSKLYLGIIRIGNGQAGFGNTIVGFTATVLSGVGDAATYSTGKSQTGLEERLLVTNKGSVSLSVSALYAGTTTPPATVQDQLTAIAKSIFVKLHA
jgi:hypothetical protein